MKNVLKNVLKNEKKEKYFFFLYFHSLFRSQNDNTSNNAHTVKLCATKNLRTLFLFTVGTVLNCQCHSRYCHSRSFLYHLLLDEFVSS